MRRTWNQLLHLLLLLPCAAAMCAQQEILSSGWSSIATVQSPFEVNYVRLEPGSLKKTEILFLLSENSVRVAQVRLIDENATLFTIRSELYTRNGSLGSEHKRNLRTPKLGNQVRLSLSYSGRNFGVRVYDRGNQSWNSITRPGAPTNGSGSLSIRAQANSKYLVFLPCHLNTELAHDTSKDSTLWLVTILLAIFTVFLAGTLVLMHCFCKGSREKVQMSEGTATMNETMTMEEEHVYEELEWNTMEYNGTQ